MFGHSIFFIQNEDLRLMNGDFFGIVQTKTHYRQAVARLSEVSRCAIQLNHTLIPNPIDDVGFELLTVRQIAN
jgi:hypothetical protein